MPKEKFKLIKGGGKKAPLPQYKYKSGLVTNTRLMGVIGMKLFWNTDEGNEYIQFFHLDWEEYGIDGYESLLDAKEDEIENITMKMMGGLGGEQVEITENEAMYILRIAHEISIKNNEILPEPSDEYKDFFNREVNLNRKDIYKLWEKMSEKIETEVQLVNYYLMRAVGDDIDGQSFLSTENVKDFVPTGKPSTLIKNIVEFSHNENNTNFYRCESVIDFDNGYQFIVSHIGVKATNKGLKVNFAEIKNKMKITTIEAAFQLKKPEYILIYSIEEFVDLLEIFDDFKPSAMQNIHQAGFLYTEFNPNNEHVKDAEYYLNGDIYAVYYITTGNQLAVGTFQEKNLKELKTYFRGKSFGGLLHFEGEFKADSPILYEFVHSEYDDFYEFIEDQEE